MVGYRGRRTDRLTRSVCLKIRNTVQCCPTAHSSQLGECQSDRVTVTVTYQVLGGSSGCCSPPVDRQVGRERLYTILYSTYDIILIPRYTTTGPPGYRRTDTDAGPAQPQASDFTECKFSKVMINLIELHSGDYYYKILYFTQNTLPCIVASDPSRPGSKFVNLMVNNSNSFVQVFKGQEECSVVGLRRGDRQKN